MENAIKVCKIFSIHNWAKQSTRELCFTIFFSDGKPVKPEWHVKPQMFAEIWGYKLPISKSGQNAHLLWAPKYKRIPQCTDMKDEDWQLDLSGFLNEKQHWEEKKDTIPSPYTSFTEWCCAELESGTNFII